jgi:serine/threonine protein phosphatase 1
MATSNSVSPVRTFVIGDIHGAWKALMECFDKAGFNAETDRLICLGDACDGWPEAKRVIDELLRIKNLVYILGNHDQWTLEWFKTGTIPYIWLSQGGEATILSYEDEIPPSHKSFLEKALYYFVENNRLFVHGGIDSTIPFDQQIPQHFLWDRSLVQDALWLASLRTERRITGFDEVYVGHTPTINFNQSAPIKACEVWLMDTGAGWPGGVLSMMDIETHTVYKSSKVSLLYPGFTGRANNH